jgi:hypothetical protein
MSADHDEEDDDDHHWGEGGQGGEETPDGGGAAAGPGSAGAIAAVSNNKDFMDDDAQAERAAAAAAIRKKKQDSLAAVPQVLQFPGGGGGGASSSSSTKTTTTTGDPTSSAVLGSLRDENSSYASVMKTCLALTQFLCASGIAPANSSSSSSSNNNAGGSLAWQEDTSSTNIASSVILQDVSLAQKTSDILQALTLCLQNHVNRQCRSIACTTAALLGRAAYARLRSNNSQLYIQHNALAARLEDEVGTDLAAALATTALDDPDEGVSSAACQALGILILSTSPPTTVGSSLCEDDLLRHVLQLSTCASMTSCYAPTLRAVTDEDADIAQCQLYDRVQNSVLRPRLAQIINRITSYKNPATSLVMTLPVVTASCVYLLKTTPAVVFGSGGMDRVSFAKQWSEVDALGLVHDLVTNLLLPILQHDTSGQLNCAASLSILRLVAASCNGTCTAGMATWMTTASRWAATVLQEALSVTQQPLETKLATIATLLIASRNIPLPERTTWLQSIVSYIVQLPSTIRAGPVGISSCAGALFLPRSKLLCQNNGGGSDSGTNNHYRMPTRVTLWAEVALSFFLDGPVVSAADSSTTTTTTTSSSTTATTPGSKKSKSSSSSSSSSSSPRPDSLRKFLSLPVITNMIGEADNIHASSSSNNASSNVALNLRDEILLAFCLTAIHAGRRFRGGPNNNGGGGGHDHHNHSHHHHHGSKSGSSADCWPITEATTAVVAVEEWLQLAWVVLTAFSPCVNYGYNATTSNNANNTSSTRKLFYLEEDLNLGTAGLMHYVQLLQEYLHFCGLLHSGSSVALKLVANACPPHLIWDQLAESAAFLAPFDTVDMGLLDNTTKLMDELVLREVKHASGIPSHHMRLFLLALAADHWMQGRVSAIRRQIESSSSTSNTPIVNLDVASGREIIMALSPRRILTKIFKAHIPPVDAEGKRKKDPIKRLALETVRVCCACIENIGLIACDWRRRFGSGQEAKHLVSIAVGVLQGKIQDESSTPTPAAGDDAIKAVMGPLCDAAVGRIQAFYESDMGGADSFPASELVMQTVKTKIRPLVSSSKRPPLTHDDHLRGYLMQLSKQIIMSRIEQAVHTMPPADATAARARPTNWLRLTIPPIPESRDGRVLGNHREDLSWGTTVAAASSSSDAAAIIMAYTPRRFLRYDGEDEFRLTVLMRVFNTTAFEFFDGIRLELGIVNKLEDPTSETADSVAKEVYEALGGSLDGPLSKPPASASVVYKQEIQPGDSVTWEVSFHHSLGCGGNLTLLPSVVYRNVPMEPAESGAQWVGEKAGGAGDASTISGSASATGEDDFQVTKSDTTAAALKDGEGQMENVTVPGEPLVLSPLVTLQPCPLVFFRDRWGDLDAFRFLWFRMPNQLPEIPIIERTKSSSMLFEENGMAIKIANISSLTWNGEAIPGGYVTRAWAFATLSGNRVMAVLAESDSDKKLALHFRGDDKFVLYSLIGSSSAREAIVAALAPGMTSFRDHGGVA